MKTFSAFPNMNQQPLRPKVVYSMPPHRRDMCSKAPDFFVHPKQHKWEPVEVVPQGYLSWSTHYICKHCDAQKWHRREW